MLMYDVFQSDAIYNAIKAAMPFLLMAYVVTSMINGYAMARHRHDMKRMEHEIYKARRQLVKERMKLEKAKRH